MTEPQLAAVKRLAERFGSDLSACDVVHDPFDLPSGWVSVVVHKRGTAPSHNNPVIVAGVSPDGDVHT